MALDATPAPEQVGPLGEDKVLPAARRKPVAISWHAAGQRWQAMLDPLSACLVDANPSSREDPGRSESIRPGVGAVLRGAFGDSDGQHPTGPLQCRVSLDPARDEVFGLRPTAPSGRGMACPSSSSTSQGWHRLAEQSRSLAPELPPTGAQ